MTWAKSLNPLMAKQEEIFWKIQLVLVDDFS